MIQKRDKLHMVQWLRGAGVAVDGMLQSHSCLPLRQPGHMLTAAGTRSRPKGQGQQRADWLVLTALQECHDFMDEKFSCKRLTKKKSIYSKIDISVCSTCAKEDC